MCHLEEIRYCRTAVRMHHIFSGLVWVQAVDHYSAAIALDGQLLAAYNNRALAHLRLGEAAAAETDCDHVLLQQPGNVKALLRRAAARRGHTLGVELPESIHICEQGVDPLWSKAQEQTRHMKTQCLGPG